MPHVSIITATYNAGPFIDRTIRCVLSQSHTDFEWIVVDDDSSDDTVERLLRVDDPRMRILRQEANGGPSRARNAALRSAQGSLVALLDHDDVWAADRLEHLVSTLEGEPELGFASSNMHNGDPERPAGATTILANPDCSGLGLDDARTWLRGCSFSPSTAVVRTDVLRRAGGWEDELWFAQDWELVLRLWLDGERARMLSEPLGWTVIRAGQLSSDHTGTFDDRRAVLRRVERDTSDATVRSAAARQRREWERDEARRRLSRAMTGAPGGDREARELARWALRHPLPPVELVLACAYASIPRAAGALRRLLGRG